jgi:hypothetical protein
MGGAAGATTCPVCGNENAFEQLSTSGGWTDMLVRGCNECGYDYERRFVNIKGEYPHRDDKGVLEEPTFYIETERLPIIDGKIRRPQEMETVLTAEGVLASRIKGKLKPGDIPEAVFLQQWKDAAV